MPTSPSTRLGLIGPSAGDDLNQGDDVIRALITALDLKVLKYDQGALGSRPTSSPGTPGTPGFLYRATDGTNVDRIFYDYGTGWIELATAATAGAFKAYRATTAQALPAASATVILFNAEAFDVSGWFDITTGRYTPQIPGYYEFSWAVRSTAASASNDQPMTASLRKSGSTEAIGLEIASSTGARLCSNGVAVAQANGTTDYFEISVTSALAFNVEAQAFSSYFCGRLVGRT